MSRFVLPLVAFAELAPEFDELARQPWLLSACRPPIFRPGKRAVDEHAPIPAGADEAVVTDRQAMRRQAAHAAKRRGLLGAGGLLVWRGVNFAENGDQPIDAVPNVRRQRGKLGLVGFLDLEKRSVHFVWGEDLLQAARGVVWPAGRLAG